MPCKKKCPISKKIAKIFGYKEATVAVIRLTGIIGGSGMMKKGLSLETVEDDIEAAFKVKNLKAVALQINSPGGSPVQSELIFNRIRALSAEKEVPVYTFVEDVAASGGYWLACAGDEIYASENSIVGSIGVIGGGFGYVDTLKKLGMERRVYTQGENKNILDPFLEEKPKDVEIILSLQKEIHASFKNLVRSRRGTKIDAAKEDMLFSGQFWTGSKGKELGLVDEIGDMHSVLRAKFGDKINIEKITKPKSWIKRKLAGVGVEFADGVCSAVASKVEWSRFGM